MKLLGKKGQALNQMGAIFVGLATVAIVTVVTHLIISQTQTQLASTEGLATCNGTSLGCNATFTTQNSVNTAVNFIPLIVIAAVGALLLGLVALFRSRN